jgi:membrane protein insertase Oxa1/YidC/SpoIIIJ
MIKVYQIQILEQSNIFLFIYFILSHLPNIFLSFLNPNLQVRIKSPNFEFLIYIFVLYFLYYHKMHTQ